MPWLLAPADCNCAEKALCRRVYLEAIAEPVYVAFRHRPLSPDADDDMVLDVAINGNADVIVTNNTRHFRAGERFGVATLTPAQLLSRFRKRR